ncbi:conjugal transfer protein TrbD [Commensalibacter nepenthis]|uniref:Conjugal transfer protein TrbD n=1 Tax=Commensalibacter nepenthis TaxID=3043872 RepID=A0ABT6QAF3_9PROT|nr:conjugal transfer protein TrbD [Commensalibacter sp. TBRC 10068]MDI2113891.1 conjugal transfer protein TrbD [Commensalibacter sp. TBRC 10068]
MNNSLRHTPIYRALHRANLLMGGERKPVLLLIMATVGLAVTSMNLIAIVVSIFMWITGIFCLRMMAKSDPFMIGIYFKSIKYKGYYYPRSKPSCNF